MLFVTSVEFAHFLAKLVKAVVPVNIRFHFFCAHGTESTAAVQKFALLVKKAAHLRADVVHALVTHCKIVHRSQREC